MAGTPYRTRSRWTPKMAAAALAEELRDALPETKVHAPRYNADRGQYQIAIVDLTNPDSKGWGTVAGGAIVTIEKNMDVSMELGNDAEALAARIRAVVRSL
jgi:hypothetical protein